MHKKQFLRFLHTSKLCFTFALFVILSLNKSVFSQVKINEVLAINATWNYDPQFYNFHSWIELYNPTASNINVGGYYLSDSRTNPTKWVIPANTFVAANGYLLIWCDKKNTGIHTNYEIDADGEGIYFYTSSLTYVDSIRIPQQYSNVSYGRISNGTTWGYLQTPTPYASNGSIGALGQIPAPTLSLAAGRYATAQTLTITSGISGVQIRYTTDGSEPTSSSALYSAPIAISATKTIKVKLFSNYAIPSKTITRTYLIGEHASTLPVISVSMNPTFLWDNTIGMYTDGTNGITGNCEYNVPKNYNQDWGRYCVVEYFNSNGISEFNKDFESKIYGACSRNFNAQKSLAFYCRSQFGKGHLEFPLFKSKDIDKFDNFVLRNSGNDFNNTHFRDGLMQSLLVNKMDVDWMAYQPAVVYLNGAYWGIMNIREKLNENYIEHNHKVDKDSLDFLEGVLYQGNGYILAGDSVEFMNFFNTLGTLDMSKSASFDYIDQNIDVNEYINYLVAQMYYVNTDWPGNNLKFWQPKKSGGKWRWILFDTDFGFNNATHQTLNYMTDSTTTVAWPNPQWSTLMFRRIIKNPTFREKFIQTFMSAIYTTFEPSRVTACIDSIASLISAEMPYHKTKWGGTYNNWENAVYNLKSFASARYSFMPGYIQSFFNITSPLQFIVTDVNLQGAGTILLNNVSVEKTTIPLYEQLPYTAKANPATGYRLKQWNIIPFSISQNSVISRGDSWKYNDTGIDLGTNWFTEAYNDNTWASGLAQFGYGEGDEKTVVSFGPNSTNKYITTYFRKKISITDTTNLKSVSVSLLADDGAVIYINGLEAVRMNMPTGAIAFSTLASVAANENVYITYSVDGKLFKPGSNTIAVEIHQNAVSTSDLSFDMDMQFNYTTFGALNVSTQKTISDVIQNSMIIQAEFEAIPPVSQLYINEIAAKNTVFADNYGNTDDWFEIYNGSNDSIDLSSIYLTDNFTRPTKFGIINSRNTSNIIPPFGFKLFWADEEEHQGINHCSFKLSGTGERLGIYQISGNDTLAIDTLTYGIQPVARTWGRFPDGANQWVFMSVFTPQNNNQYTLTLDPLVNSKDANLIMYPNPAREFIYLKTDISAVRCVYQIYSASGKQVASGIVTNQKIPLQHIPNGIYYISVSLHNRTITQKIQVVK